MDFFVLWMDRLFIEYSIFMDFFALWTDHVFHPIYWLFLAWGVGLPKPSFTEELMPHEDREMSKVAWNVTRFCDPRSGRLWTKYYTWVYPKLCDQILWHHLVVFARTFSYLGLSQTGRHVDAVDVWVMPLGEDHTVERPVKFHAYPH